MRAPSVDDVAHFVSERSCAICAIFGPFACAGVGAGKACGSFYRRCFSLWRPTSEGVCAARSGPACSQAERAAHSCMMAKRAPKCRCDLRLQLLLLRPSIARRFLVGPSRAR
eukprot:Amastigsp_a842007_7.p2 type:complete len:112 gc:universal Amastigsp_a842007_7:777-442(-)